MYISFAYGVQESPNDPKKGQMESFKQSKINTSVPSSVVCVFQKFRRSCRLSKDHAHKTLYKVLHANKIVLLTISM